MDGAVSESPEFLLDLAIIDCPDAMVLAEFYGGILGWGMEDGASSDWAVLDPPGGGVSADRPDGRSTLAFQRIDDYVAPTWPSGAHPQHFHLDISVADIAASEPKVLAAGARLHEFQPSENGRFRVYLDPAGHPFCLILR